MDTNRAFVICMISLLFVAVGMGITVFAYATKAEQAEHQIPAFLSNTQSQKDVYTRLMLKNCLERESGVK